MSMTCNVQAPRKKTTLRPLLWGGAAMLTLLALLAIATSAQAASMSLSGFTDSGNEPDSSAEGTIQQDGSVDITVTATAGELFQPEDLIVVENPFGCVYTAPMDAGPGPVTRTYPDDFSYAAGDECYDVANTWTSGSQGSDLYEVSFFDDPAVDIADPSAHYFMVRATDQWAYERTEEVIFRSFGHDEGDQVLLNLEYPDRSKVNAQPIVLFADDDGLVQYHYAVPRHTDDSGFDLGFWTAKFIDTSSNAAVGEDRQVFEVLPTIIQGEWATQPGRNETDSSVPRMNITNAEIYLVYRGSLNNGEEVGGPRNVTFADIDGSQLNIIVTEGDGNTQTATATFNQQTDLWRVDYTPEKVAPVGPGYFITLDTAADRSGNLIALDDSDGFSVVAAEVTPTWTIESPSVERASLEKGVKVRVRLAYQSGAPLTEEDLGGDELRANFYRNGNLVGEASAPLIGQFISDGTWTFEGAVPKSMPLGMVQVRLTSPQFVNLDAPDGNPNRIDRSIESGNIDVKNGKPSVVMTIRNGTDKLSNVFLRGPNEPGASNTCEGAPTSAVIRARVDFQYGTNTAVTDSDVFGGQSSRGRARLSILPNSDPDSIFHVDLTYNSQSRLWERDYCILKTDPVGSWSVTAVMSDRYGNQNTASTTLNVGLRIDVTLSTDRVQRSQDLVVTATLTKPGSSQQLTGTVTLSVRGPGGVLVDGQTMDFDGQRYEETITIPVDAPLGTYVVEVAASHSSDNGLAKREFDVISTGISAIDRVLSGSSVPRLEEQRMTFRLVYPSGDDVPQADVTPVVNVVSADGSFEQEVDVSYSSTNKRWSAAFTPDKSTPLGGYRFVVGGIDSAGNELEQSSSNSWDVVPAVIEISRIQSKNLQYERGSTIQITAEASYADGSLVTTGVMPITVRAGTTTVATVDLTYDVDTSLFTGEYPIKLGDPLSSPTAPWVLVAEADSMVDETGNTGPEFDVFSNDLTVNPARISVQIVEQPSTPLKAGRDQVTMRFTLTASDGTFITGGVSGIEVLAQRGGTPVGNASISLDGDAYVASFALGKNLVAGEYILVIQGTDESGNEVNRVESDPFTVTAAGDKGAPGLGLVAAIAALGAVAVLRRRI